MKARKIILIIFILILLLGVGYLFKDFILPAETGPIFGNRLNGMEEVEITTDELDQFEEYFSSEEVIASSKASIMGKIIKNIIIVETDDIEFLKEKMTASLELFDEDELNYYDFEFILDHVSVSEGFPLIGYKNKKSEMISFTN